ncbi:hypothetical protein SAY87_031205 [Trapa incisa]|uniref:Uncharacterized protein n=1 Tax=Trapa incisa TaxID=236973 RepID=A0AAN7QMT1_9MYRT|nr:hypothetical protein SAY87_031205 [Trapa incisa]
MALKHFLTVCYFTYYLLQRSLLKRVLPGSRGFEFEVKSDPKPNKEKLLLMINNYKADGCALFDKGQFCFSVLSFCPSCLSSAATILQFLVKSPLYEFKYLKE